MKSDWVEVDKFFREHQSGFTDDDFIDYVEKDPILDEMLEEQNLTYEEALPAAEKEQNIILDAARQSGLSRFEKPFIWIDIIQLCEKELTEERLSMLIWLIFDGKFTDKLSDENLVHVWLNYKSIFNLANSYKKQFVKLIDLLAEFDKTEFDFRKCSFDDVEIVFYTLKQNGCLNYYNDTDIPNKDADISEKEKNICYANLENFSKLIADADFLKSVKPLIYYQLFVSYRKKMQTSNNFGFENIKLFTPKHYNIYENNGKNFNQYAEYCNLYADLKKSFPDVDKELCDAGFLIFSNIAEWRWIVESMGYDCEEVSDDIPVPLEVFVIEQFITCFDEKFSYKENDVSPLRFVDLSDKYSGLYRCAEKEVSKIKIEELTQFANDPIKFCAKFMTDDFTKEVAGRTGGAAEKANEVAWRIMFNAVKDKFDELLEDKIIEIFGAYTAPISKQAAT